AVSHAINREGYLKKLNGLGVYSNTFIGPEVFGHPKDDKGPKFDQESAQFPQENHSYMPFLQKNGILLLTMV
ncbi:hypothetical protein JYA64_00045, partial [Fictibacillus barbaricus]|nr:hypothetical protein [Fictibacillus barbaricus]